MRDKIKRSDKCGILFGVSPNISLQVAISHWNKDFYTYAKGYKDAADFIVLGAIDGSRHFNFQINELVFPIVFLYRQYVELRLKDIISLGNRLNGRRPLLPPDLQDHEVQKLWKKAKPIIKSVSSIVAPDDLEAVETIVKAFKKVDPTGMVFRYPVDKKGCFHLPEMTVVNLGGLKETMQKVGEFLDGYSEYLTVLWQERP